MGTFSNVIARIKAIVTADNKQFKSTMKDTQSETKKTGGSIKQMGNVVKTVVGGVIVASVVKMGKKMLEVTKGLDLMNIKATAVFGAYKKDIIDLADQTASSMGLTKTEFVNAASGIQDLLIPIGFARKEATSMTTELMGLAGALSTWTGGMYSAKEVGDIFAKAMLGEREQLKALGIAISEAEIQMELAKKGMKGLTGEALAQAKAQITMELITRKSTDAQEAFKGAQDSMVVTMAKTGSNIRSMGESLAVILSPALRDGAKAAESLSGALAQMLEDAALISSSDLLTTAEKLKYRFWGLVGGASGLIKQMEILGVALTETEFDAMVDQILDAGGSIEDVEKALAEFGDKAIEHGKNYYDQAKKLREKDAAEAKAAEEAKAAAQREQWQKQLDEYRKNWAEMQKAQEEFNTEALIFGMEQAEMESKKLAKEVHNVGVVMDKIPEAGLAASLGVQQLAMNMQSAAYKAAEFEASMKAVWTNMQEQGTMVMNQFVSNLARASEESGILRNKMLQDTLKSARGMIRGLIAEGVAAQVSSALKNIPFPFGLIAGAAAGAGAMVLFDQIIPSFAEGGMVTGPTLAMVGDNPSGKEIIIPWEKLSSLTNTTDVNGRLSGDTIYLSNKRFQEKLYRTGRL